MTFLIHIDNLRSEDLPRVLQQIEILLSGWKNLGKVEIILETKKE